MLKVYLNHSPQFALGPLGCFDVKDRVEIPDYGPATIVSVDGDGAGVAYLDEWLETEAKKRGCTFWEAVTDRKNTRTCYPYYGYATKDQIKQMKHQCKVNRAKYGKMEREAA